MFQRRHYEFIADNIVPLLSWPSDIGRLADLLNATNHNFNRDRFLDRATAAWEDVHRDMEADAMNDGIDLADEAFLRRITTAA